MSTYHGQGQLWDLQPWQKAMDQFDGSEQEGSVIPDWLSSALLSDRVPVAKESKAGFFLMPAQVLLSLGPCLALCSHNDGRGFDCCTWLKAAVQSLYFLMERRCRFCTLLAKT